MLRLTTLTLLVLALAFARVALAAEPPARTPTPTTEPIPAPVPPAIKTIVARRPKRKRVLPRGIRAVEFARHLLGIRYHWGGTSPRTGFDCSGFVRFVFDHVGVHLPRVSYQQFDRGRRVSRRGLRPGDLVFFRGAGHVGIYIGNGRFIHAPHTGTVVSINSLAGSYSSGFDGGRRVA
jgi:cell wall-associated NlpC family hydrolase